MSSLRVAFAGASGTGKTTLATWVAEAFNVPMNPTGARSVAAAMGFASPYDVDRAGRRAEFQRRLLTDKMAWEESNEQFVTDRTTLDNLTYTLLHDVASIDGKALDDVRVGLARYSHVFFCPMDCHFKPGDDAARVKRREYHEVFEQVLYGLLISSGVEDVVHVVNVEGLGERKAYIERVLKEGVAP
jgi:hypothetical protein